MDLELTGFNWDEGNTRKNWIKHGVSIQEAEEIFFNQPLLVAKDERHSQKEERHFALGRTNNGRYLFAVYTVRKYLIRIISARNMSRKERNIYHACEKENPKI